MSKIKFQPVIKWSGSAYNVSRKNGWLNEMTWLSSKRKN